MKLYHPRKDFTIIEDYFSADKAKKWLTTLLHHGQDSVRGFHHPDLRPNRFHKKPKYPVKKFMCYGLYWNPLDYRYTDFIPGTLIKPFSVPHEIYSLCTDLLSFESFSRLTEHYEPQSVMVNYYTKDSRMGLHVDKDEEDKNAPIIGMSFGSTCKFFFENEFGAMEEIKIPGNSVYLFGKSARMMRHGVGTIYQKTLSPGSENLLHSKERINLTIRQVYSSEI